MLTRDDLIDLIMEGLRLAAGPSAAAAPAPAESRSAKGRLFLSEYEIKKRLTPQSQLLTIPKDAIISPLATDWLVLKGIKIVRQ